MAGNPVRFVVSPDGDVVINVKAWKNGLRTDVIIIADSATLKANSGYFERCLRFNSANGHGQHVITLEESHGRAMGIWVQYLHAGSDSSKDVLWKNPFIQRSATMDTLWHVICEGDKYNFGRKILDSFFERLYSKLVDGDTLDDAPVQYNATDLMRQLPLPCLIFNYAPGFAEVTRWLVYNSQGQILEKVPGWFKQTRFHLAPKDFVGPMNLAHGRLRVILHQALCGQVNSILKDGDRKCKCQNWEKVCGRYIAALIKINVNPLESGTMSINELLDNLAGFSIHRMPHCCTLCNVDWEGTVVAARTKVASYFDGLCLDCMDRSKRKRGDPDQHYWKHCASVEGRWDHYCRIAHGESTWYHSWLGRDEHRQKLIALHREDKRTKKRNSWLKRL
ncbi:hypothetical protein B0J11DRAFT_593578 [Dendryphion nanum]|uniref:Uncharacterized protein n=1 Tax=Dendryphion nanum TaxID=256645 RepID=A0A9P9IBY9_9PLEO|nr:hypothetical protein B0J11DRAFT_593578 [Dendryphion nanum]